MCLWNDTLSIVYEKTESEIKNILQKYINNPIKIKYIIITKNFEHKRLIYDYYPEVEIKYLEDVNPSFYNYLKKINKI